MGINLIFLSKLTSVNLAQHLINNQRSWINLFGLAKYKLLLYTEYISVWDQKTVLPGFCDSAEFKEKSRKIDNIWMRLQFFKMIFRRFGPGCVTWHHHNVPCDVITTLIQPKIYVFAFDLCDSVISTAEKSLSLTNIPAKDHANNFVQLRFQQFK